MIYTPCETEGQAKVKFKRILKKCDEKDYEFTYDALNNNLRVVLVPRTKMEKCDAVYSFSAEEEIMTLNFEVCGKIGDIETLHKFESCIEEL